MKYRIAPISLIAAAALAIVACGSESAPGGGAGADRSDPDKGVASPRCPVGTQPPDMWRMKCKSRGGARPPRYQLVTPRRGMEDLHTVAWHGARPQGRTVLVRFWSGVEPCYVLDHVDVIETPRRVVLTLYEGHDPEPGSVACIEIAKLKAAEVRLDRPLGSRTLVDGSTLNP